MAKKIKTNEVSAERVAELSVEEILNTTIVAAGGSNNTEKLEARARKCKTALAEALEGGKEELQVLYVKRKNNHASLRVKLKKLGDDEQDKNKLEWFKLQLVQETDFIKEILSQLNVGEDDDDDISDDVMGD